MHVCVCGGVFLKGGGYSPLPNLMGFSFLSTANTITELLCVPFSDFSLNPPPILSLMNASGELPSQMDILSHIITRLARLPGWGRQNNFLSSTIMQSNKGA